MLVNFRKHLIYYLSLIFITGAGIFLSTQVFDNRETQIFIIFLTSLFYVSWGLIHHLLEHDLNSKIVVEYILIGTLGFSVVWFFIRL